MKILTEEEIADYHASPNVSVESRDYEFSFDDHEASFVKKRESEDIQIYYRLLLGYFRLKRIRIKFDPSISEQDLKFIREKYFPHFEGELIPLTSLRKSKIYDKVFSALNITAFKEVIGEELKRYLSQEIRTKLDPRELFDQSLDWLDHRQIERPSYRILSRIISEVVGTEKSRIKELVERNLTNETQDALMSLLTDSDSKEVFDAIRYQATDFRSSQISKEEKAYIHLKPIYEDVKAMVNQLALSKANIEYYASLLNHYDVWELKRSDKTNFCLYFACFISQRFKDITDYFVSAFEHHYKKIHSSAKESVKNRIIRERESMAALMVKAGEVLELFNDKTLSDPELRRSSEELLSSEQRTVVANYLKSIEVDEEAYYWEYIDSINTKGLKILRKIFQHLNL